MYNVMMVFDRTLNWNSHISLVTKSCFGILSGLSHLRHCLPHKVLTTLPSDIQGLPPSPFKRALKRHLQREPPDVWARWRVWCVCMSMAICVWRYECAWLCVFEFLHWHLLFISLTMGCNSHECIVDCPNTSLCLCLCSNANLRAKQHRLYISVILWIHR